MSFFNKVSEYMSRPLVLTRRLYNGGWEAMGHIKREPDTRTTEQLLENIEYFANKCPEVAKFKKDLKSMNPEHLGLVSDICELANHSELLPTSINIRKPASNGKSLFEFLLEKLPIASKENPEALELSKAIIDNSDSMASKFALGELSPLFECKEAAQHIKATIPLVSEIAETTLHGGYTMDYTRENLFINALKSFISPSVQLEKLELLPRILELGEKAKALCTIDALPFLQSKTPTRVIVENMKTFEALDKNMEGKALNLTEFLERNVNLA